MIALDIDPKYFASMMQRMADDEVKELDTVTSERIKCAFKYSN